MMRKKPRNEAVAFIRTLLLGLTKSIAEFEDEVRIANEAVMQHNIVFEVFVDKRDMGLVLGERGETADAIRRIMWTACKKTDFKIQLTFVTTHGEHHAV